MSRTAILCAADLHLGVRPSRLPEEVDAARFATAVAWRRLVERAVADEEVGLVVLAGDVVDRANRYFEAFGPLEAGLTELAAAGVAVVAVAGNHDHDVLGRLAATTGGDREGHRHGDGAGDGRQRKLHLLGAGGRWERFTWRDAAGTPRLHVDGWSFPEARVADDPAALYDLPRPADGAPVLGLVHGDLGQAASPYAPLARAALARLVPDAWVVGHVHRPALVDLDSPSTRTTRASDGRWLLVPGSPQPLDPGEPGRHGAWRTVVDGGRLARPEPVPVATLRYEPIAVDLEGVESGEEAEDRAATALLARLRELAEAPEGRGLEQVLLRVSLTGRTAALRALPAVATGLGEWRGTADGVAGAVESAIVDAAPAVDLGRLAAVDDPPGLLAGLLLELEGTGPEAGAAASSGAAPDRLAVELADRLEPLWEGTYGLLEDELDPAATRPILVAAARRLLDELLGQRASAGGGAEAGA